MEYNGHGNRALPAPYALILVCVVPSARDLEIARVLGWYRIPVKYAPKVVRVDYLAFFQPAGESASKTAHIQAFAEVNGVELTTRRELIKDEPHHPRADEEYYKIQIGPLRYLKNPITTGKWRRMTFLYTTGDLFAKARVINDLVVRSDERKILWHSLREKASQLAQYNQNSLPGFDMNDNILAMLAEFTRLDDEADWLDSI